jgi:hypothetical protein
MTLATGSALLLNVGCKRFDDFFSVSGVFRRKFSMILLCASIGPSDIKMVFGWLPYLLERASDISRSGTRDSPTIER